MIPIGLGVVKAMGLERTKPGIGIMLSAFLGTSESGLFVYNPSSSSLLYSIAKAGCDRINTNVSYGEWFCNGVVFILQFIAMLVIVILVYRPKTKTELNSKEYFKKKLENLGVKSAKENRLAVILIMLFLFLFTTKLHGIAMIYGFVAAVIVLYIPFISIGEADDIKNVDFAYPIFIVACFSIGNVATDLGLSQVIVDVMVPVISQMNIVVFLIITAVGAFLLNTIMTPLAIYSAFLAPVTAIAMSLPGINNVYPLLAAFYVGTTNVIFPYEIANTLVLYSYNTMSMSEFVKAFSLRFAVYFLVFLLAIGYWYLIGLLG